ncbi:MAG TPA: NAD-dependent epimerase/dehydratase family protein [Thermoanaerobaculia bacterium]|nr:NAD-dependent epimerase/dehydratase family protein [Thermoanaerobaculia bacterium]
MKTLVTGGAGFIGSNLVRALLRRGADVVVLDNFASGYRDNLEGIPTRLVNGDVRDPRAVNEAIRGCERVFHLAASVGNHRSIENPQADSEINVLGTLNVLEAARRESVRKLVFASSAGIFGALQHLPIRENHPAEPDTPYGASKLGAEKLCLVYAKLYPLSIVCLRFFNVYGPLQRCDPYGNVIPIFAERILTGKPLVIHGDGMQTRDFVHVDDVVQAALRAADADGVSGAFNIASGAAISINELAKMMCDLGGVDSKILHGPPRIGDVRDSVADVSAAREAFGYAPSVALNDGLSGYLSWASESAGRSRLG